MHARRRAPAWVGGVPSRFDSVGSALLTNDSELFDAVLANWTENGNVFTTYDLSCVLRSPRFDAASRILSACRIGVRDIGGVLR